ncbi:MAG: MBL fold metallo-hydrolase [Bacillota bacterium]|nr:MBL fold metallo-hydrolase [Bacillota bacterium]
MKVLFKGTRGTMPVPGKDTVKYGGNTSCVMVEADGKILYFDAGSGLSVKKTQSETDILKDVSGNVFHLFLSHLHYDHMIGFPFFRPFFDKKAVVDIYGPKPDGLDSLEDALRQYLRAPFMPFNFDTYRANIRIHQLGGSAHLSLSERLDVDVFELVHPNGCFSYRLTLHNPQSNKNVIFVYATDTMDFTGRKREEFLRFIEGADLLVIDAFFDDNEMNGTFDGIDKRAWGHCSWEQAVALAQQGNVSKLALFHHLDTRTDTELDEIENEAKVVFPGAFCAFDGCLLEL